MKPAREERLQTRLREVWEQARDLLQERIAVLEVAVAAPAPLPPDLQASAVAAAHKLAGSLGMFGLRKASACARDLERQFSLDRPDAEAAARLLLELRDLLRLQRGEA